jgi:hypothetical protein
MSYLFSRTTPCHFIGLSKQSYFYTANSRDGYGVFTPRAIFVGSASEGGAKSANLKIKSGKDLVIDEATFLPPGFNP